MERALVICPMDFMATRQIISFWLGKSHSALYQEEPAKLAFLDALNLAEEIGEQPRLARAYREFAMFHDKFGRFSKAIEYHNQAFEIFQNLDLTFSAATTLRNRAQAYRMLGKPEQALSDLETALVQLEPLERTLDQAHILSAMGTVFTQLRRYEESEETTRKAIVLYEQIEDLNGLGVALTSLSSILPHLDKNEEALETAQKARDLLTTHGDLLTQGLALHNIGWALKNLGRLDEGLEYYHSALEIFQHIDQIETANTLIEIGQIENLKGNRRKALSSLKEAITVIEENRKTFQSYDFRASYLATQHKSYDIYIEFLMDLYRSENPINPLNGRIALEEALEISEQSRARSQIDALFDSRIQQKLKRDSRFSTRLLALENELDTLETKRVSLEESGLSSDHLNVTDKAIRKTLLELRTLESRVLIPKHSAQSPSATTLDISQIREEILDQDTALLEYYLGEERSFLWAISQQDLMGFELPGRKEIEELARETHRALSKSFNRRFSSTTQLLLEELSHTILEPASAFLENRRLLIVADGSLQYIPFGALINPTSSSMDPMSASHEIIHIPSASTLAALRRDDGNSHRSRILMVYDPVFNAEDERLEGQDVLSPDSLDDRFDRLKFSAREADAVRDNNRSNRLAAPVFITGFEANRDYILEQPLSEFEILHFATHGELHSDYPELSRLVLSRYDKDGKAKINFLFAHQISRLSLNADLVILSACQTALGPDIRGEGMIGLPSSFMFAGASSVIVSLWNVDDQSTAELMSSFYDFHLNEGLPPSEALQAAQGKIRQRWPAPYYWAAFIFKGDWH